MNKVEITDAEKDIIVKCELTETIKIDGYDYICSAIEEGEYNKDSRYDDYILSRKKDGKLFRFGALMSDSGGFHRDASDSYIVEVVKKQIIRYRYDIAE